MFVSAAEYYQIMQWSAASFKEVKTKSYSSPSDRALGVCRTKKHSSTQQANSLKEKMLQNYSVFPLKNQLDTLKAMNTMADLQIQNLTRL